jgi:hypothetical protein
MVKLNDIKRGSADLKLDADKAITTLQEIDI